jgi:hypothetical protein
MASTLTTTGPGSNDEPLHERFEREVARRDPAGWELDYQRRLREQRGDVDDRTRLLPDDDRATGREFL